MKKHSLFLVVVALLCDTVLMAQSHFTERDTIDVLHYNICLDMGHHQPQHIQGWCEVTMQLLQPTGQVSLGLEAATIDSVQVNGVSVAASAVGYDRHQLRVPVASAAEGDTLRVKVYYGSYGWQGSDGGFWCDPTVFYNLGEDRLTRPFSMGRSWFPCSDSVYDRATYSFAITAASGWSAFCSGDHDSTVTHADSSQTFYYTLHHPVSTYQVGVNVAQYYVYRRDVDGYYGTYPLRVASFNPDSADVAECFASFDSTLTRFERWFGPYPWGGIGFSAGGENVGMEHVNNICVHSEVSTRYWRMDYLIDHEFAHQWFGNLITCDNLRDMWFNEGGATFADQIGVGKTYDRYDILPYHKLRVVSQVPKEEGGFHPLCGMPNQYSFMHTTYYKGAMVFHELRHLLGDSTFFGMLQTLFSRNAFTNMDSYQLRDSMSLYSGVDLTDFYNFHIFSPGFASYHIDSMQTVGGTTNVWLSQLLWGASEYNTQARVPITFFSNAGDSVTRDVVSNGHYAQGEFQLPFVPDYAVVDYYGVTAVANVTEDIVINSTAQMQCVAVNMDFCPTYVTSPSQLKVTLQFGDSDEPLPAGIKRWSSRRWIINGTKAQDLTTTSRFYFGDNNWVNDGDFYTGTSCRDSIRLFYRKDASHPWKMRKSATVGHSSSMLGVVYYMENSGIQIGEYILAVVDTARLNIDDDGLVVGSEGATLSLSPNPAHGSTEVCLQGVTGKGELRILDATGREVCRQAMNGQRCTLSTATLPAGLYFVTYTSPEGICTQKLVVR
ncbi:MAG: T9SS type A sorting domain-containing protein [Bacteroidales bacterium]|nr:T9SS type A sorting domain-containing protein [Bacteroidales bacterium]